MLILRYTKKEGKNIMKLKDLRPALEEYQTQVALYIDYDTHDLSKEFRGGITNQAHEFDDLEVVAIDGARNPKYAGWVCIVLDGTSCN